MAKKAESKKTVKAEVKPAAPVKTAKPPVKTKPKVEKKKVTPEKPVVLKPGQAMTEKKLQTMARRGLQTNFLLVYDFMDLLCSPTGGYTRVKADAALAVCPPGYDVEVQTVKLFGSKGKQVTLEVRAKLSRISQEPLNGPESVSIPLVTEIKPAEPEAAPENPKPAAWLEVPAILRSDDEVLVASFDCQEWFEQATDLEIVTLAHEDFENDTTSDKLAEFFDGKNARVTEVFEYIRRPANVAIAHTEDVCGFSCRVESVQAISWIEKNRPHLMDQLVKIEAAEYSPDDVAIPSV